MNQNQRQLLNDCSAVLTLRGHPGWEVIQRDARANFDAISFTWFNHQEGSAGLREAMIRQQANQIILTLLDQYEEKLQEIGTDLLVEENPELIQGSDVDTQEEEE